MADSRNPIVGALITLKAEFKLHNVSTDPSSVSFTAKRPDGSTVIATPYRSDTNLPAGPGVYYGDLSLDQSRRWYWQWKATGRGQAIAEGYIDVDPSSVG